MSELEETAKAVAETAKFGTKSVEAAEKALGFFSKVFKMPIEQASGIIGDQLKFIRWQRQLRMIEEAERILNERKLNNTRAVPPKLALSIIENAGWEENNELQDLWIKLLANSMDPNFCEEIRFAFIEIIKSLNPIDVKILHAFYNSLLEQKLDLSNITEYSQTKEVICARLNITPADCVVALYNLFRVQCLAPAIFKMGSTFGGEKVTIFKGVDAVTMTPLGIKFVQACVT